MVAVTATQQGQAVGGELFAHRHHSNYRLTVMALLWLALVVAGGASRYDEPQQLLVRLAAIAALAATAWPLEAGPLRAHKRWLTGVVATYALVLLQLVPMPLAWWERLPGHGLYAEVARATHASGWRPLSLTPDLTLNSLFALLPLSAAGLSALYLRFRDRRRLARWIVGAALLGGMLGLVQLALGGDRLHFFRQSSLDSAVGFFANRNHQAAFLACALPYLGTIAGCRLREGGNSGAVMGLTLTSVVLLSGAIAATGSRTGIALGAVGMAGAAWCFKAAGASLSQSRGLLAAGFAGVVGMATLVATRIGIIERLAQSEAAAEARAEMVEPLLRTAGAFMPLGSGFGSFDSVYRRFEPDHLLSTIYMNHAHNEPLQLAIEGGVPALALLGLFLAWWARTAIRLLRADLPASRRSMAVAAIITTAMLMGASLVDYPLRTPLLGAVFAIACVEMMRGAAVSAQPSGGGSQGTNARPG